MQRSPSDVSLDTLPFPSGYCTAYSRHASFPFGPDEKTKPLRLDNVTSTGLVEAWLFDADHLAEKIGEQPIASDDSITLLAQSISLYILP